MQVFAVDKPWDEHTITWDNAPVPQENTSRTLVQPLPGDCAPTPSWYCSPGIPYQFDVTEIVRRAQAQGRTWASLALYTAAGQYHSGKYFYSREGAEPPIVRMVYLPAHRLGAQPVQQPGTAAAQASAKSIFQVIPDPLRAAPRAAPTTSHLAGTTTTPESRCASPGVPLPTPGRSCSRVIRCCCSTARTRNPPPGSSSPTFATASRAIPSRSKRSTTAGPSSTARAATSPCAWARTMDRRARSAIGSWSKVLWRATARSPASAWNTPTTTCCAASQPTTPTPTTTRWPSALSGATTTWWRTSRLRARGATWSMSSPPAATRCAAASPCGSSGMAATSAA